MPESPVWRHYPIKQGRSVAPEIALKCNIDAAILADIATLKYPESPLMPQQRVMTGGGEAL